MIKPAQYQVSNEEVNMLLGDPSNKDSMLENEKLVKLWGKGTESSDSKITSESASNSVY